MKDRVRFLMIFLTLGCLMKVVGEFIHEAIGHGFFVFLFGGRITRIHIALLWPYHLSNIGYSAPESGFLRWQIPWIDGGGILVCLLVTVFLQILLLFRFKRLHHVSIPLFWLSFWTFLNPAGYLFMGGIEPFGDIWQLIHQGVLTQNSALGFGFILFLGGFLSLTTILKNLLVRTGVTQSVERIQVYLSLFWLVLPVITMMALMGVPFLHSRSVIALSISFLPSIVAYRLSSSEKHPRIE